MKFSSSGIETYIEFMSTEDGLWTATHIESTFLKSLDPMGQSKYVELVFRHYYQGWLEVKLVSFSILYWTNLSYCLLFCYIATYRRLL